MTIRKSKQLISQITKKIKKGYRPEKIILFGSYAYGKPSRDSDLDLLIIKHTNADSDERWFKVRKLIRKEIRDISIMPLVYTPEEINKRIKIGDDFIAEILKRGKVLYG